MLTEVVIAVGGWLGGLDVSVGVEKLRPRGHLLSPPWPRAHRPPRPGLGLRQKGLCILPEHRWLRHLGILCGNKAFKICMIGMWACGMFDLKTHHIF